MLQKLASDLFIILVNNPKKPLHVRNYFKSKIFWKRLSKSLKKGNFLLSSPVSFNRQNYQKQKGPGTSDQLLFRLRNKFRKIPLLVMYYLTKFDDVIWSSFLVILKITSSNYIANKGNFLNLFCKLNSNWSLVPGPFCVWSFCLLKGTGFERKNEVALFKAFW